MPIYVMLTKISPYAVKNLERLKEIEKEAERLIEENCPVATIIRSFGHVTTETRPAIQWKDLKTQ